METRVEALPSRGCDFRSLALLQIQEATTRHTTKVEVPDSAVGHIIGKAHRTINALGHMPGITHVSVHEDLENEEKQTVLVEGSEAAIAEVLAQIKRLHMRSYAASVLPEMHYACFVVGATRNSRSDDPLILRIAGADMLSLHMPQHLRSFLHRNFPEDFDDRTYYYFHSRSSGEAAAMSFIVQPPAPSATDTAVQKKPSIRKKFLEKSRASLLLGSWEKTGYHHYLSGALAKLLAEAPGQGRELIKIRLVIGKTMYFGTSLCKGELWKLSVAQMDDKVLYQTLRPMFSVYSSTDSVRRARKFLRVSGYLPVRFTRMISAQLVDMDSDRDCKESYHLELDRSWSEVQAEPVVRFRKVCKRHTFLTLLNDHRGVDMELRIQSRESEEPLDSKTKRLLFEAWHNVSIVEQPLQSPCGKRYYPLNVLHNDAETYSKDGFEVVITKVTAGNGDSPGLPQLDKKRLPYRWKVSIRCLHLHNLALAKTVTELEVAQQAEDILHHVDLLLSEASKLAMSMACS